MNLHIEFLYFRGCPNHETARQLLREVLRESNIKVTLDNMRIDSHDEALAKRFLGSPTIRINGVDIEPGVENHADFGMQCRVYRINSKFTGVPSKEMIRAALQRVLAGLSASTVREDNMHASERFLPSVCC